MNDQDTHVEAEQTDAPPSPSPETPLNETPPGMDPIGLASASRSCLVILILLTITALLICVATVMRVFF